MTAILVFLSLVVATVLGWAVSIYLLPAPFSRRLALVFAPGVGMGICSLIYFISRRPMFTLEFILLIAAIFLLYRRRIEGLVPDSWRSGFLGLIFACIIGFSLTATMIKLDRMPHGNWDGWAIWSAHARLLARDGPRWMTQLQHTFHGDYPKLTPSLTARIWRYAGTEFPEAGGLIGIFFGLSGVGILVGVLSELRGSRPALVMGTTLISTPFYLDHMTSQYSEVPLAFFNLMTVSLLCMQGERAPNNKSMMVLAGFAAGCAGWTKNEGLLFIAAACAALALPVVLRRSRASERLAPFLAGLLIPLAVIVVFKLVVPVQNDLIAGQSYEVTLQRLTDLKRYDAISRYLLRVLWTFGTWTITPFVPLFLFFAARGVNRQVIRNPGLRTASLILAIVLAGYFAIYVNTPLDLTYHMDASFDRLILHLWPAFLLLLGLCVRKDASVTGT